MVDRIAQQVAERCIQALEHVAVHRRRGTDDLEPHLLAERAAEIAQHARRGMDAVGEGPHAAGHRLVVQPARQIGRAPLESLHLGKSFRQQLLALGDAPLDLVQCNPGALFRRRRRRGGVVVKRVEPLHGLVL